MSSLIPRVTMSQLKTASKQIKDVTIPALSLYLATENRIHTDEAPATKHPFYISAMKNHHLTGMHEFLNYTHQLKKSKLGKLLLDRKIFSKLLDDDEFNYDTRLIDSFDPTDMTANPDVLDANPSARVKILHVIAQDPSLKSVDDVFMYVLKHYLGDQRILLLPKASDVQLYIAQFARILTAKYGGFIPDADEYDADPNVRFIPFTINSLNLFKHGYHPKDLLMQFEPSYITDYNPDSKDQRLSYDRKRIMTHSFLYVGYRPDARYLKLIKAMINEDTDDPAFIKHAHIYKVDPKKNPFLNTESFVKGSNFMNYKSIKDSVDPLI